MEAVDAQTIIWAGPKTLTRAPSPIKRLRNHQYKEEEDIGEP